MRKLLYVTIGFAAACALCTWAESNGIRFLSMIALTVFFSILGKEARPVFKSGLILFGCIAGFFWNFCFYSMYLNEAVFMDGVTRQVSIRAMDYSYETAYGLAFDGRISLNGNFYQVRTYIAAGEPVTPGQQVTGSFRFRVTTLDGTEEITHHQGKGIFLLAYQEDETIRTQAEAVWQDFPAKLRREIKSILQSCFPEDTFPLAKALLLGDCTDLSYQVHTDFRISGIRHIIAISGMHVSILFALISTVTFRKRALTALLGFPILFLFMAVAGFTPSVTRACIMSGLMLTALLLNREYDGPIALTFAVLVMLILNPLVITSVSFQLSVASVAGIFLFEPGIRKWMLSFFGEVKGKTVRTYLIRWVTASISVTLSAMVLTTPLCAYYFGTVSLIGVVTNLLVIWVISFTFYGIMAVCLVYLFYPAGAAMLGNIISIPIRYVLFTAGAMADIPLAAVYTCSPYITAWLVFVYVLLILFLRSPSRKPALLSCCAILGLCAALLTSWTESMLDDVRFTVLDVGQGQCLLLQSEGRTYMVDCGGDSDTITADLAAEALLSQGINRLDGLILTHYDRDHAGAAANFMSRVQTDLLILPPVPGDLPKNIAGKIIFATENLQITLGDAKMQIFPPIFLENSNENSLCVLFDSSKCDILITGDRSGFGERALLRSAEIPDVDILVAGHHGSKNAACEELLAAVRPEIVCISVGEGNPYGHPAAELLERLANSGCSVYRTDLHGTITIRR